MHAQTYLGSGIKRHSYNVVRVFQQFWTKRDGDELRLLGKFIDHGSHLCAIIYIKCLKGKQTDINYLSIPLIVRII